MTALIFASTKKQARFTFKKKYYASLLNTGQLEKAFHSSTSKYLYYQAEFFACTLAGEVHEFSEERLRWVLE
jgi:hypothetical protein